MSSNIICMFQQQVKEIKFEEVYIQRLKQKAFRTNKIRDWLLLLKAYQQNNLFDEKDKTIQIMHLKFVLNQSFWIQQINRKQSQSSLTQRDIEFILMALDDGFYKDAAQQILSILIKELNNNHGKSGTLRPNFLVAKIQYIFSIFKRSANLFPPLRNYYKTMSNDKKARQLYLREIKLGFDDLDIVYDEYVQWQKDMTQVQKSKIIYETAKENWEVWNNKGLLSFLSLVHFNTFDPYNYFNLIQSLETDFEKLRYLRIICLSRHELVNQYFQLLQCVNIQDEQVVIDKYQNVIGIIPDIETSYLKFLVRRINKHKHQLQDETYNASWSEKVMFFRGEIASVINKPKATPKIQQQTKQLYYNFWVDVQTALIKDKESICQLFQALLQVRQSIQTYVKYCNSMIMLDFLPDAKQILKRCCDVFKQNDEVYRQYQNFLGIYGTVFDVIELRKLKMVQSHSKTKNIINTNNNHIAIIDDSEQISQDIQKNDTKVIKQQQEQVMVEKLTTTKVKNDKKADQQSEKDHLPTPTQQKQPENTKTQKQNGDENESEPTKRKMHTDSGSTLYIKGYPTTWKEDQVRQIIKNKCKIKQIRLIEKMGIMQDYCYVDMASEQDALNEIQQNEHKKLYQIAISRPPSSFNQDKTLFLGGLPHNTTTEAISNFFKEQLKYIVDIRLKIDENRNIGYVDFESPQIRDRIYQKYSHSNIQINNKKIFIKLCSSKGIHQKKQNNVLILKQLAFNASQKNIVQFFSNYSLEDIYIPKNQNGKSKGFAFVKFKNTNEFHEALAIQKGTINGRTFQIHKSNRDIERPKSNLKSEKQHQGNKIDNNYFNDFFT